MDDDEMVPVPPLARPVTWATCARINAVRWAGIGALLGLVATAVRAWWSR